MRADIVILSYSKTAEHIKITKDCIDSLLKAKNKIGINIYVLESYNDKIKFEGTTTIFFKESEFNYNRSMNEGFKYTKEKAGIRIILDAAISSNSINN